MIGRGRSDYLFSAKGLNDLASFADRSALYAFDLDGTLSAIAYEPHFIIVEDTVRKSLVTLMKHASVAIVTGRSVIDARHHLGLEPHYLIGNHGAEGLPGQAESETIYNVLSRDWEKQARSYFFHLKKLGITIENKGVSLSFHYRNAGNREEARIAILDCIRGLKPKPRHISGKYVENIIPVDAPDKGSAVRKLLHKSGCDKVLYAGDDDTDEDVFSLKDDRVFSVHIGAGSKTKAKYYLKNQHEIGRLIQSIIALILRYNLAH